MNINVNHWRFRSRFAAAALLASLAASPAVAQDFPTTLQGDGPLAYWPFNETTPSPAPPTITNGTALPATGYVVADVDLGQPVVPFGNPCPQFNNAGASTGYSSSKIDIPWQAAINPNPPYSIEFWAKPNTISSDSTGVCPVSDMNPYFFGANRSGSIFYLGSGGWQMRIGGENSYSATAGPTHGGFTEGGWQLIDGEFDGTSNYLYINGVLAARGASTPGGFKTNGWVPFRIGSTFFNGTLARDGEPGAGNRGWDGWVSEVSVYNTLLSGSRIAAHYAAGSSANFHTQVLADSPVAFWPLEDASYTAPSTNSYPVSTDVGSIGADGDGTNTLGAMADQPGVPYAGFPANNKAVWYDGETGSTILGPPDAALQALVGSPITYMAWIKPSKINGWRTIIEQGFDAATGVENYFRIGDTVDWEGTGVPNTAYYEVGAYNGALAYATAQYPVPTGDMGNWVFLAGTWDGANWNLYRDGVLVAQTADEGGPVAVPGNPPFAIGSLSDPDLEDGWYFSGTIDEPAIFNTALSGAQILALYNSAKVSPVITQPPVAPSPVYLGSPVTFTVAADGVQPLSYQWVSNGVAVAGQTGTSYTINSVTGAADGNYSIIVSNAYGTATSTVTLLVTPSLPPVSVSPLAETRWNGFPFSFTSTGVGNATVNYSWEFDGVATGAATSNIVGAATSLTAGSYSVIVNNSLGAATSSVPGVLTVKPVTAGYPAAILNDHPIAYYRLDETSGTVAHDYAGGFDGQYNNVLLGQPGYVPSNIDPDTAVTVKGVLNSYVGNISPTGINFSGTTNFTIEAWANGAANQINGAALVAKGTGNVGNGGIANEQFSLLVNGAYYSFLVRSPANTANNGFQATGLVGPDGTWHYVVGEWDGANVTVWVDGVQQASAGGPATIRSSTFPVSIGAERSGNDPNYDLDYAGTIDEVGIYNYALTQEQIQAHYAAAFGPSLTPQIALQPVFLTNYVGLAVTLSVSAYGSVPLSYQWNHDGVGAVSGATAPSLTIPSLQLSDAGTYFVGITNANGGTSSVPVVLTVLPAPTTPPAIPGLVVHLTFDGNLIDATGRGNNGTNKASGTTPVGPSYVPDGELGQAFHYATTTNSTSTNANYVTLGVRPDLQFGTNVNFSVCMWIRLPSGYVGDDLPFFTDTIGSTFGHGYVFAPSFGQNGAAAGWQGAWAFSLFDSGALQPSGVAGGIGVYGDPDWINDGVWHHLAYVFDRKTGETTYLDGVSYSENPADVAAKPYTQSGTTAAAALDIDTANPATIGQDATGVYPEQASADIDDLGVFRRALTSVEVGAIYSAAANSGLSYAGVSLTFSYTVGANHSLTFTFNEGALESSTNVAGPYTVISTTSPYTAAPTGSADFFKVKF